MNPEDDFDLEAFKLTFWTSDTVREDVLAHAKKLRITIPEDPKDPSVYNLESITPEEAEKINRSIHDEFNDMKVDDGYAPISYEEKTRKTKEISFMTDEELRKAWGSKEFDAAQESGKKKLEELKKKLSKTNPDENNSPTDDNGCSGPQR